MSFEKDLHIQNMPKISTLQSCSDAMIDDIIFHMKTEWNDFTKVHLGINTFSGLKRHVYETYLKGGVYPIMFVMYEDNDLLGFVSIDGCDHKDFVHIAPWINNLFVVDHNRGKGYSKLLLQHALKYLAKMHFDIAYLCCKPSLNAFYTSQGWDTIDTLSDDMILMSVDPSVVNIH
jgi:GNAT superfamily N-acetyltransferase